MRELKYIDETIERNGNPVLRIGSAVHSALSTVYLMDCIEGMKQFPDKFFDLAVVDPPYGLGESVVNSRGRFKRYHNKNGNWDMEVPTPEYFAELKRVSKEQIIWGGNYFDLPPTQCFIFWYKQNPVPNFADGELAWTSFKKPAVCIDYRYYGNLEGKSSVVDAKIHPTQKPVALYDWILKNYAKEGNLILDTHLGSQSSRIAANKAGLDFVGFEIDREYYDNGNNRFKDFVSQTVLF